MSECKNCEKKEACIPFFEHEGSMEHMKSAHKMTAIVAIVLSLLFSITVAILVSVFVTSYTSRTDKWLSTYASLQNGSVVTYGVQEQPSP